MKVNDFRLEYISSVNTSVIEHEPVRVLVEEKERKVRTLFLEIDFRALCLHSLVRGEFFYKQMKVAAIQRHIDPFAVSLDLIQNLVEKAFRAFETTYPYPLDHLCMWVDIHMDEKYVLLPTEFVARYGADSKGWRSRLAGDIGLCHEHIKLKGEGSDVLHKWSSPLPYCPILYNGALHRDNRRLGIKALSL